MRLLRVTNGMLPIAPLRIDRINSRPNTLDEFRAASRPLIQIVDFNQPDAGRVALPAHDGGVSAGRGGSRGSLTRDRSTVGGQWQQSRLAANPSSRRRRRRLPRKGRAVPDWDFCSAPAMPKPVSDGPIARTITSATPSPAMKPPINTLSPASTKPRVLMLASFESAVVSRS